ncbi:hypothetical protein Tco_0865185 [Tanacetum coccineum]
MKLMRMKMQVMMMMILMMFILLQDMGFAMKKRSMMVIVDDSDHGDHAKVNTMENDQEFEPNNHHSIPRGSWQSGQGQSGQSTSNDNHD